MYIFETFFPVLKEICISLQFLRILMWMDQDCQYSFQCWIQTDSPQSVHTDSMWATFLPVDHLSSDPCGFTWNFARQGSFPSEPASVPYPYMWNFHFECVSKCNFSSGFRFPSDPDQELHWIWDDCSLHLSRAWTHLKVWSFGFPLCKKVRL